MMSDGLRKMISEFICNNAIYWGGESDMTALIRNPNYLGIAIDGLMLSPEEFLHRFPNANPRHGFQSEPVKSNIGTIVSRLKSDSSLLPHKTEVFSLEWSDLPKECPGQLAESIEFEGKCFLKGSMEMLESYSLMNDTLATPFVCFGRTFGSARLNNPTCGCLFVIADCFDETAFVLLY